MTLPRRWHRLRTAATMGRARQALAIEAAASLLHARATLAIIAFPTLAARWGVLVPPGDPRSVVPPGDPRQRRTVRRIRWAIATVAPLLPFRTACVQQAVAARAMLARRGIVGVVHFGIGASADRGIGDDALDAGHAWLDVGGQAVTGFPLEPALVELGCFVRCP